MQGDGVDLSAEGLREEPLFIWPVDDRRAEELVDLAPSPIAAAIAVKIGGDRSHRSPRSRGEHIDGDGVAAREGLINHALPP